MKRNIPGKTFKIRKANNMRLLSSDEDNTNEPQRNHIHTDDEILIKQAFKINPEQGCEMLFRRYHQPLCSHAIRFVYSKDIAEDIVSGVFFKLWRTKAYASIQSSYRFYLFRSVRNAAYTYLRMEFKSQVSLEFASRQESTSDLRPDCITHYEETYFRLKVLIEELPPQCRKVFLKSRFEGKRYQEIASDLGISIKTVEVHIVKALNLIRKGLKDYLLLLAGLTFISLFSLFYPLTTISV